MATPFQSRKVGTPRLNPVQQLGGVDVRAIRNVGQERLLSAFSNFSSTLATFGQQQSKEAIEKAVAEGQAWRKQSKEDFKSAVKAGTIDPTQNPWFAVGAMQTDGIRAGTDLIREARNEWKLISEDPEDPRSFDPNGFTNYWEEKVANFAEESGVESHYWTNSFYDTTGKYFEEVQSKETSAARKRWVAGNRTQDALAMGSAIASYAHGITGRQDAIDSVNETLKKASDQGYQNPEHTMAIVNALEPYLTNPTTAEAALDVLHGMTLGGGAKLLDTDAAKAAFVLIEKDAETARLRGIQETANAAGREANAMTSMLNLANQVELGDMSIDEALIELDTLFERSKDAAMLFADSSERIAKTERTYNDVKTVLRKANQSSLAISSVLGRIVSGERSMMSDLTYGLTNDQKDRVDREVFSWIMSSDTPADSAMSLIMKQRSTNKHLENWVEAQVAQVANMVNPQLADFDAPQLEGVKKAVEIYSRVRESGGADIFLEGKKGRLGVKILDNVWQLTRNGQTTVEEALLATVRDRDFMTLATSHSRVDSPKSKAVELVAEHFPDLAPDMRGPLIEQVNELFGNLSGKMSPEEIVEQATTLMEGFSADDNNVYIGSLPGNVDQYEMTQHLLDHAANTLVRDGLATSWLGNEMAGIRHPDTGNLMTVEELAIHLGYSSMEFQPIDAAGSLVRRAGQWVLGKEVEKGEPLKKRTADKYFKSKTESVLGVLGYAVPLLQLKDVFTGEQMQRISEIDNVLHELSTDNRPGFKEEITFAGLYERHPEAIEALYREAAGDEAYRGQPAATRAYDRESLSLIVKGDGSVEFFGREAGQQERQLITEVPMTADEVTKQASEYRRKVDAKVQADNMRNAGTAMLVLKAIYPGQDPQKILDNNEDLMTSLKNQYGLDKEGLLNALIRVSAKDTTGSFMKWSVIKSTKTASDVWHHFIPSYDK